VGNNSNNYNRLSTSYILKLNKFALRKITQIVQAKVEHVTRNMQHNVITIENLLKKITDNTLIIGKDTELVRFIKQAQQNFMHGKKIFAYPDINISTFDIWQEKIFSLAQLQLIDKPLTLLNHTQEKMLWLQIIKNNNTELLDAFGLAQIAQRTYQEINAARIDVTLVIQTKNSESKKFFSYLEVFLATCEKNSFIAHAALINYIADLLKNNLIAPEKNIIFLGNFVLDNAFKNFLQNLKDSSSFVEIFPTILVESTPIAAAAQTLACNNINAEIMAMSLWAKKISIAKPKSIIACYVPNLAENQRAIASIFKQTLGNDNFYINSKIPLYNETAVFFSLLILKISLDKLTINEISFLLRCHLITNDVNLQSDYALLDAAIRKTQQKSFTRDELINFLTQYKTNFPLITILNKLNLENKILPINLLCKDILLLLKNTNLLNFKYLSTRDLQAFNEMQKLIIQLEMCADFMPQMNHKDILEYLIKLTKKNNFTAKSKYTNIKIFAYENFNGLVFAHTWVLGANTDNLPRTQKQNPFVTKELQKLYKIKKFSFALLLQESIDFITSLSNCNAIFSYSIFANDLPLTASALIKKFPTTTLANLNIDINLKENNNAEIKHILDLNAPLTQTEVIAGGSSIFKMQAHCPFKAFAKIRLKSNSIAEIDDAKEKLMRGNVIHKALELLWQKLKTQQNLLQKSNTEISELVAKCVVTAIKKIHQTVKLSSYLELEKICAQKIILKFLEQEKTRLPFTVISCEEMREEIINDIKIKLRIDRIDKIANGALILIDYKTGTVTKKDFFGKNLNDPQLPLYAIINGKNTTAITYAHLSAKKSFYSGVSKQENITPTIKPIEKLKYDNAAATWEEQLDEWQKAIANLATELKNGVARTDPKKPEICAQCDLHGLCRIKMMGITDPMKNSQ